VRNAQFLEPLFEFSSACTGCGETPYVRLLTQLLGDRLLVANATGCSSIYGGTMPTTPWAVNAEGRGPAWSNSLFEDNAEFGLGMRVAVDKQAEVAQGLLREATESLPKGLLDGLLHAPQNTEPEIGAQRERVVELRTLLAASGAPAARRLEAVADMLVRKSVWLIGGDGWAYDIGYGGLDHVLASGRNVNALVLDTEVYSNTGGQASKATPLGAIAKFATGGKSTGKKDLGRIAMVYGHVYVAQIAMGASDTQALRALEEAESYPGPSLVIAYSPCIAHGIEMSCSLDQAKLAVASGAWPLYRYDPRRRTQGLSPLQMDSKAPSIPIRDYVSGQTRFRSLFVEGSVLAEETLAAAQAEVDARWGELAAIANRTVAAVPPS
jgi:pyruvate-ferredoxin/flavodoxin oxidoreductase